MAVEQRWDPPCAVSEHQNIAQTPILKTTTCIQTPLSRLRRSTTVAIDGMLVNFRQNVVGLATVLLVAAWLLLLYALCNGSMQAREDKRIDLGHPRVCCGGAVGHCLGSFSRLGSAQRWSGRH